MNPKNIGDKLKNNVHAVLTGGGTMDDIKNFFDLDEADKRKKQVKKKADIHMMPESTSINNNNKNEKKLLEDISVFMNQLEAKHQIYNIQNRKTGPENQSKSREVAVNQNNIASTASTAKTQIGGSGRMYNKCRKLEDEFSGMI